MQTTIQCFSISLILKDIMFCRYARSSATAPQFDALIDLLTGRELLTLYARLRGIPECQISQTVENLAVSLSFEEHIDKISKTYR